MNQNLSDLLEKPQTTKHIKIKQTYCLNMENSEKNNSLMTLAYFFTKKSLHI